MRRSSPGSTRTAGESSVSTVSTLAACSLATASSGATATGWPWRGSFSPGFQQPLRHNAASSASQRSRGHGSNAVNVFPRRRNSRPLASQASRRVASCEHRPKSPISRTGTPGSGLVSWTVRTIRPSLPRSRASFSRAESKSSQNGASAFRRSTTTQARSAQERRRNRGNRRIGCALAAVRMSRRTSMRRPAIRRPSACRSHGQSRDQGTKGGTSGTGTSRASISWSANGFGNSSQPLPDTGA